MRPAAWKRCAGAVIALSMRPRPGRAVKRLLSSLAVRQAALSTLVVLAAILGFGMLTLTSVYNAARADLLHTIDTDIAGLVDGMVQGGPAELERRIADRTGLVPTTNAAPYYRLSDMRGRRLAGNIAVAPSIDPARSDAAEVVVGADVIFARATVLRGSLTLIVGRSLAPLNAVERRLEWTLAAAAVVVTLLSLAIGLIVANRLAARVGRMNAAFASFGEGVRAPRLPTRAYGDEIDVLGGQVDLHLDRIERLLVAQRDITDNIAHELRTPLAHLDTRLLTALDHNRNEHVARTLDAARADIRSVVSLFDALLDIAMADPPGTEASRATIDLSELAADIGELYAASAEEAGLAFTTRISPVVTMRGEAMQMTRLIANLLDNAFKYVPAGCRVLLSVAPGPVIVVEDNGLGIPEPDRATVFERFRRSAILGEGHGLGLALVRVIATRHGLTARVEDAAPGARFVIAPGMPQ